MAEDQHDQKGTDPPQPPKLNIVELLGRPFGLPDTQPKPKPYEGRHRLKRAS
jgi:hypothetical protein